MNALGHVVERSGHGLSGEQEVFVLSEGRLAYFVCLEVAAPGLCLLRSYWQEMLYQQAGTHFIWDLVSTKSTTRHVRALTYLQKRWRKKKILESITRDLELTTDDVRSIPLRTRGGSS